MWLFAVNGRVMTTGSTRCGALGYSEFRRRAGPPNGYETAAHLVAVLPQAHDVIAFSTRPGEGTSALAEDPRAAFTLYLCYLMLGDDESSEERAAELYRASRGE